MKSADIVFYSFYSLMTITNILIFSGYYLKKKIVRVNFPIKNTVIKEMVNSYLLEQRNLLYMQALYPDNIEKYLDNLQFVEHSSLEIKKMISKEFDLNNDEVIDIKVDCFGSVNVVGTATPWGKPKFLKKETKR